MVLRSAARRSRRPELLMLKSSDGFAVSPESPGMLERRPIMDAVIDLEVETSLKNHPMCRLHRDGRKGAVQWKCFAMLAQHRRVVHWMMRDLSSH